MSAQETHMDTANSLYEPVAALPNPADPGDFFALLKPRVMSLVVFTALVGVVLAPGNLHPFLAFVAILCIAVGAGASGALNMWYDADIDAEMDRTKDRPIPAGRISPEQARTFGLVLSIASVGILGVLINWMAAGLLAFTILFYVAIYTMWLKRRTPQNIVIGGAAGALPPVVGWAAVTGDVSLVPLVLFLIIFVWTPPHFWALALVRSGDYEKVQVPMMPNVAGPDSTRRQILIYSLILTPLALLPVPLGAAGALYGTISGLSGAVFLWFAFQVFRKREGETADKAAKHLFAYSILYLFLLFAVLLVEQGILPQIGIQL